MLPGDLPQYTSIQEDAIDRLTDMGYFISGPTSDAWTEFKESVWGKKLESFQDEKLVRRDSEHQIEDPSIPPGSVPDKTQVTIIPIGIPITWGPSKQLILTRSEYEEAEEAALLANRSGRDVFLVTGQPGIGKTYFLLRLLIRRLVFELPTAWQIREDCVLLFHKNGVREFKLPKSNEIYGRLPSSGDNKIWALVDSNQSLEVPAGVFIHGPPFFVVEAASPRSPRLQWLRKVNYEPFYMKRWSFSEVLQARSFLGDAAPHTEHQLWYLHNEFGASPRALAHHANRPEIYENEVVTQVQSINPQALRHTLNSQDSEESSHLIVVVDPHPNSRLRSTKTIASQHIFRMLWDKHLLHQASERRHFYHLFQANDKTAAPAGWLFECQMHQLLRRNQTIRLFPVRGKFEGKYACYDDYSASRDNKDAIDLQLPASDDYSLEDATELHVGHYYRPRDPNFPTVDSIFFIHPPGESPILLMFQVTCNKSKHGVDLDGLERIKKLLPQEARAYYVVVTPTYIIPEIKILKSYFRGQGLQVLNAKDLSEAFPVFHYPVDEEALYRDEQSSYS